MHHLTRTQGENSMQYTGTCIDDLMERVQTNLDALLMQEAIMDLDPFGIYTRPCWHQEPIDEYERRTR